MAEIGEATLNIVPKVVGGLGAAITEELGGTPLESMGESAGKRFIGGVTSGAAFGVFSEVARRAFDVVAESLDSAAARVDTLNNYPKVMQQLGQSSEDANASIKTMSDALSNVPTRLDDMATTVQGLFAATQKYGIELGTVTDAGLALNNMLLAGGQSTGIVNSAMEQFRQMVSKGKPELQDWRSMLQAAPGQMNQLAEAMLGAGKTADDLYEALGGGKRGQAGVDFDPEIKMDEFVRKFASMKDKFAEAAEDAQGGIGTSFANMQNAVTRGVAGVIEAFGQERIASAINDVKGLINGLFGVVQAAAADLAPVVSAAWDAVFAVVDGVGTFATKLSDGFRYGFDGLEEGRGKIADLNSAISEISGLGEGAARSYTSLGDAVNAAMDSSREATQRAKDAHDDYLQAVVRAADGVREAMASYEGDYRRLDTAGEAIEAYGNKADITSGQQWELRRAIETVNEMCGTQYKVLEDGFTVFDDSTGKVVDNTQAILDNVEARKYAAKAEAIGAALAEEEKVYDAAAAYYAEQKKANDEAIAAMDLLVQKYGSVEEVQKRVAEAMGRSQTGDMTGEESRMAEVVRAYNEAMQQMGDASAKMQEAEGKVSSLGLQFDSLSKLAQGAEVSTYDLAAASGVAAQAFSDAGGAALNEFALAIDQCASTAGESGERLRAALSDPQAMADIVAAYDGTAESLQGVFEGLGVTWDAARAKQIDATDGFALLRESVMGMADVADTLGSLGVSADELAQKWSAAGLTAQDMANLGSDGFARLAGACNNNLDAMIAAIDAYNAGAVVLDKDGRVNVDDQQLRGALEGMYEFNRMGDLTDKNGKVLVRKDELTDAYEWVARYNDLDPKDKDAKIHTDDGGLPSLYQHALDFMGLPDHTEKHATFTTDNVTNEIVNYQTNGSPHASGGHMVPRHASGFIAAGPTRTRYGVVGEDGIEAVWNNDDGSTDVYPLNNPRYLGYAKPLAESIAANLARAKGMGGTTQVNVYLNYDAGATPREMAIGLADNLAQVFDARGW